jgi:uncharacterized protein (DUF2267 family)
VLARHTSKGEIEDVKNMLPKALQELWPGAKAQRGSRFLA